MAGGWAQRWCMTWFEEEASGTTGTTSANLFGLLCGETVLFLAWFVRFADDAAYDRRRLVGSWIWQHQVLPGTGPPVGANQPRSCGSGRLRGPGCGKYVARFLVWRASCDDRAAASAAWT
jgi:hypothetical protein